MVKNKKLRTALIGFGGMGHFHAGQYKNIKNCELTAICDIDKKQFGKRSANINIGSSGESDLAGIRTYLSYEELVKSEKFDLLDICLPCHLHAEYAVRAMRDGFNVICEKPMARTSALAKKMLAVSKQTKRKLMIAQCLRFMAPYMAIKEAFDSGKYGRLLRLDMRRNGALPSSKWYRDFDKSGGALLDLHLHDIDFINHMLGTPDAVMTFGIERDTKGVDDLITNYIYRDGPRVSSEGSWCRGVWASSTVAVFEKATLDVDGGNIRISVPDKKAEVVELKAKDAYASEIEYFADCVIRGVEPERCLPESALESIRIAEAEERSARNNGRRVSLKK